MIRTTNCVLLALSVSLAAVLVLSCSAPDARFARTAADAERAAGYAFSDGYTHSLDNRALAQFDELVVVERGVPADRRPAAEHPEDVRGGELRARVNGAETEVPLPLMRSDVVGEITLHVCSVTVTQAYANPYDQKIEAVYVFPLPQNAAVTDFIMQIGERRIRGIIREREEARRVYEQARAQGHVASLLTQERPNIFTQSVANIEPGKRIDVEIAYFHALRYADGAYELAFPMVVGPRFNPPGSTAGVGAVPLGASGTSGQATEVSYLPPGHVSPHVVSLAFEIDAGIDVGRIESPTHPIDVTRDDARRARVTLRDGTAIPNRDFVLRYEVAREEVHGAIVTQRDPSGQGGVFTLVLQPPQHDLDVPATPREMIFVVDCSGSMRGEPLAACKRAIRRCLDRLDVDDTFQIIRFSNSASTLGRAPMPATIDNLRRARAYVDSLDADGGTMVMRGIRAALDMPHDGGRRKIVTFMTDGYIGNEAEILGVIHEQVGDARIFSFGVGSAPNRYLLERMAHMGRGASAYVGLDGTGERAVDALYRRVERPPLTDLEIDWSGMDVEDVYPARLPDLFVDRPILVTGRFRGAVPDSIEIRGRAGDADTRIRLPVGTRSEHDALVKLWARAKIQSLENEMTWSATPGELAEQIKFTALEFGMMSRFTAFVAADTSRTTEGDHGTTVPVAVPVPHGVRYETTVGR